MNLVDGSTPTEIQEILLDNRRSARVDVWERAGLWSKNSEVDFILAQTSRHEVVQAINDDVQISILVKAHA